MTKTEPIDGVLDSTAPLLAVEATYLDPVTGALYVHEDLRQVRGDWDREAHISPFAASERFGDVASWTEFVTRYSVASPPLLTWNTTKLRAVLDFGTMDAPGRGAVTAEHPFQTTRQFLSWTQLADNRARTQKALIEALEERRTDIRQPDAATIVGLLRALKVSVNLQAESSMDEHGNTTLKYSRDTSSPLKLPPAMTIGIPILKGHTAEDKSGKVGPVIYELDVLIRVDQEGDGDKARVMFRLTIPNAEQALEDAVMDRVATAKALLGEELTILRGA